MARVLLAEDDGFQRAMIGMLLEGTALMEAHNGLEALAALLAPSPTPPHLALLDLDMPLLTGAEVATLLRGVRHDRGEDAAPAVVAAL
eukprot:CAMPEP_0206028370 /NCGR_PEP_ID=MMETSP1464-20131121/44843_1 /ASSEMBLY_ACC=CAM_ASM_001124 /TAXON_ID=119497 /ORGANISM="Exanthemachrysis gayraliae, Strain RCC1523" /LENGTH=87 /DNA_ID=CAMNT_0053402427 /DNA_START=10 /DNA_END=269 /DNA_ORIENTATION=+